MWRAGNLNGKLKSAIQSSIRKHKGDTLYVELL